MAAAAAVSSELEEARESLLLLVWLAFLGDDFTTWFPCQQRSQRG